MCIATFVSELEIWYMYVWGFSPEMFYYSIYKHC